MQLRLPTLAWLAPANLRAAPRAAPPFSFSPLSLWIAWRTTTTPTSSRPVIHDILELAFFLAVSASVRRDVALLHARLLELHDSALSERLDGIPFDVVAPLVRGTVTDVVVVVKDAVVSADLEPIQTHFLAHPQRNQYTVQPRRWHEAAEPTHVRHEVRMECKHLHPRVTNQSPLICSQRHFRSHVSQKYFCSISFLLLFPESPILRVGDPERGSSTDELLETFSGGAVEAEHHLVPIDVRPVREVVHDARRAHDRTRVIQSARFLHQEILVRKQVPKLVVDLPKHNLAVRDPFPIRQLYSHLVQQTHL